MPWWEEEIEDKNPPLISNLKPDGSDAMLICDGTTNTHAHVTLCDIADTIGYGELESTIDNLERRIVCLEDTVKEILNELRRK